MSTFDGFIKEFPDITGSTLYYLICGLYINPYLYFSRPFHTETSSNYTTSCVSFPCTLGPHDRSLNIFFVLRLLYGRNETSKTPSP